LCSIIPFPFPPCPAADTGKVAPKAIRPRIRITTIAFISSPDRLSGAYILMGFARIYRDKMGEVHTMNLMVIQGRT
jgi:hypothetical protein